MGPVVSQHNTRAGAPERAAPYTPPRHLHRALGDLQVNAGIGAGRSGGGKGDKVGRERGMRRARCARRAARATPSPILAPGAAPTPPHRIEPQLGSVNAEWGPVQLLPAPGRAARSRSRPGHQRPRPCPAACIPQGAKAASSGLPGGDGGGGPLGGGSAGVRLTRSQTRALAAGASLSGLLSARSEACAGPRRQAAQPHPASPLPDIDGPVDRNNPLAACDYVNDLYRFYRRVEPEFRVPADYMAGQVRHNARRSARVAAADCPPFGGALGPRGSGRPAQRRAPGERNGRPAQRRPPGQCGRWQVGRRPHCAQPTAARVSECSGARHREPRAPVAALRPAPRNPPRLTSMRRCAPSSLTGWSRCI